MLEELCKLVFCEDAACPGCVWLLGAGCAQAPCWVFWESAPLDCGGENDAQGFDRLVRGVGGCPVFDECCEPDFEGFPRQLDEWQVPEVR